MARREYKCSSSTKDALFASLLKLSREKGFDKVTVRDICTDAEISIGSFYHHFKSKEDLAKETYFQTDKLINEDFVRLCETNTAENNLYKILEIYVEYVSEEIGMLIKSYYRLLLDVTSISAFEPERLYFATLKEILGKCGDSGYIKKHEDYTEVAEYCLRFIRGLMFDWCVNEGSYDLKNQFEKDYKLFINGLRP